MSVYDTDTFIYYTMMVSLIHFDAPLLQYASYIHIQSWYSRLLHRYINELSRPKAQILLFVNVFDTFNISPICAAELSSNLEHVYLIKLLDTHKYACVPLNCKYVNLVTSSWYGIKLWSAACYLTIWIYWKLIYLIDSCALCILTILVSYWMNWDPHPNY